MGGEPADLGLTLEPENRLIGVWHDEETLALTPARPLRRATRHTIHFGRACTATNGRIAPKGLQFVFDTPSVSVDRVIVDGEDITDEHAFIVGFDIPVDESSLREKLEVSSHGRRVPVEVTDTQLADENSFRVVLRSAEDLDFVDVRVHAGLKPAPGDVVMPAVRWLVDDTKVRVGLYRPANFSRDYAGAMGVGEALLTSRNLPAIRLLRSVGHEQFAELLLRLGLPVDPRGVHLDAALGTMSASPLQMAGA